MFQVFEQPKNLPLIARKTKVILLRIKNRPRFKLKYLLRVSHSGVSQMKWKIATFNVNGIRSREHVVVSWLEQNRPDVLCLQEIKCQDAEFPRGSLREAGYEASVCGQKSFHGVAILSVRKPEEVRYGFGDGGSDTEARLIAAKIDGIWIFNTYVPAGQKPRSSSLPDQTGFFRQAQKPFQQPIQAVRSNYLDRGYQCCAGGN